MNITEFKGVPAFGKDYRKIVTLMGKCMKEGGTVTFNQRVPPEKMLDSKRRPIHWVVDVRLEWGCNHEQ